MFLSSFDPNAPEAAGDAERLQWLLSASDDALRTGEHTRGADEAREAVALAEALGAAEPHAIASSLLGMHELRLGENEACLTALHQALTLYTELEDLKGMSSALNGMVMAYYNLGLHEEALDHASRSLEAAKQSGDPLTLAWAYNRAGLGHAGVGNVVEGIVSMEFALELARELGNDEAVFAALNNLIEDHNTLTRNLLDEGAPDEARQRIDRALELAPEALEFARASENPYEEAIIQLTHGQTLSLAGEHDRALAVLAEAERLAERGGYRPVLRGARHERARIASARGDLRTAIEGYHAVLEEAQGARDALVLVEVHLALWRAHKQLGEYRQALEHHERFHELEREQQSQLAKTRARILTTHLDLDAAQLEVRRARLDAELERTRTRQLEAQADALRHETELLSRRADQDGLTGLWNRRHIESELPRLLREAGVRGEPLGIAFVDADHFKSINDRFGHLVGDDVLRCLADVLRSHVRPTDVVARLGGEEFLVLLPGASSEAAVQLGQRLCEAVRDHDWEELLAESGVTVSVGVAAVRPGRMFSAEVDAAVAELLGRADQALYTAKHDGRDRVVLAPS